MRVLLVAETTGYQIRAFHEAAAAIGIELGFASDRCHQLDDPWRDGAIPIRFHEPAAAVEAIVTNAATRPFDGVVGVGDRPAVIAALAARALGLRASPPDAVRVAGNKLMTRVRFREAELPSPWFTSLEVDTPIAELTNVVTYPCVVKPLALAASQGVMRADTPGDLEYAVGRLRRLLRRPELRAHRESAHDAVLIEEYLPGREVALEGVLTARELQVLAIFDKPDPLEGPFFEETIYVTPASLSEVGHRRLVRQVATAAGALGLTAGPIHAECRINDLGVFVLEIAARPIGGLCARALRFVGAEDAELSLETLLLRHACGEDVTGYSREPAASGVMMIPIPRDGLYKRVAGLGEARGVKGITEVVITAKPDQRIAPAPEGSSYLGFIFARGDASDTVVRALRAAHARLRFEIESPIPVTPA